MSAIQEFLASAFIERIGWVLIHFLWQGALVAAVYAVARLTLKKADSHKRYLTALSALAVLAVLPVGTFIYLSSHTATALAASAVASLPQQAPASAPLLIRFESLLNAAAPWLVPVWLMGATLLLLRSFTGWISLRRLVNAPPTDAEAYLQGIVDHLAKRLEMSRYVKVIVTRSVKAPCAIGWFKPLILTPPAAVLGLSPLQLEMIFAHELAHIRRHDFLINLAQMFVESVLFYHPAVRWISKEVRRERECCCDDVAVGICGDALHYARALTDLASAQTAEPSMALGIRGGELSLRINRLVAYDHNTVSSHPFWKTMTVTAVVISFCLLTSLHSAVRPLPALVRSMPDVAVHAGLPVVRREPAAPRRFLPRTDVPLQGAGLTIRTISISSGSALSDSDPIPGVQPPTQPPQGNPIDLMVTAIPTSAYATSAPPTAGVVDSSMKLKEKAVASLKVIRMRADTGDADEGSSDSKYHHDYCQPITGSRICR